MRGGNLKNILSRFADTHQNQLVTTKIVGAWIKQKYNVTISARRLGALLSEHPLFTIEKYHSHTRLALFRVKDTLHDWVESNKFA